MAQETFEAIWNKVLLYAPETPVPIVQMAVKNAYRKVQVYHLWSELKRDLEIYIPPAIDGGTIDLTRGDNEVVGSGTAFTTDMVGRQLSVGAVMPWFTIEAVDVLTQTLTLDRNWEAATIAAQPYQIGQFYVEFPDDLNVITSLRNTANTWVIVPHYRTQEYLNRIDARRTSSGTPVVIAPAPSRIVNGEWLTRYEFWPRITSETSIVVQYYKLDDFIAKTDTPIDILFPETLIWGALAEISMWPGAAGTKNPLFSRDSYENYNKAFQEALHNSEMRDLERDQKMLNYDHTGLRYPIDSKFFQNHPF